MNIKDNLDVKNISSQDAIAYVKALAVALRHNQITYEEARIISQPYLDVANEKAKVIAKKYGKKAPVFTWKNLIK